MGHRFEMTIVWSLGFSPQKTTQAGLKTRTAELIGHSPKEINDQANTPARPGFASSL